MGLSLSIGQGEGKQEIKLEKRNKIKSIFRQNNILLTKYFESFSHPQKQKSIDLKYFRELSLLVLSRFRI